MGSVATMAQHANGQTARSAPSDWFAVPIRQPLPPEECSRLVKYHAIKYESGLSTVTGIFARRASRDEPEADGSRRYRADGEVVGVEIRRLRSV